MPKLPDTYIKAEADDRETFSYRANTLVSTDGFFLVEIDERLYETADKMLKCRSERYNEMFWDSKISTETTYGKRRAKSRELEVAKEFLCACAIDFITGVESSELVIRYGVLLGTTFWQDAKGEIHPNGGGIGSGGWWKPKFYDPNHHSGNMPERVAIGVNAAVFNKTTTTRATGKTTRYEWHRGEHHHQQEEDAGLLLNTWAKNMDEDDSTLKEMPYTPEAALFFIELIKGISRMALSVDNFLSNKDTLKKAIESRSFNLLGWNHK
jgi:hypothetical protein